MLTTLVHALLVARLWLLRLENPEVTRSTTSSVLHRPHSSPPSLLHGSCIEISSVSTGFAYRWGGCWELHWTPTSSSNSPSNCRTFASHRIYHGHFRQQYMKREMVLPVSTLLGRERLQSAATQNYDNHRVKLKFGERVFAVAAPKVMEHRLPDSLRTRAQWLLSCPVAKTWKPIYLTGWHKISWHSESLSVFCRKGHVLKRWWWWWSWNFTPHLSIPQFL